MQNETNNSHEEEQERICYVYIQNKRTMFEDILLFIIKVIIFFVLIKLLSFFELFSILSFLGLK